MIDPEHRKRILKLHKATKKTLDQRQADKMAKIAIRKDRQAANRFPNDKSPI
jgi:hypothetical protein